MPMKKATMYLSLSNEKVCPIEMSALATFCSAIGVSHSQTRASSEMAA